MDTVSSASASSSSTATAIATAPTATAASSDCALALQQVDTSSAIGRYFHQQLERSRTHLLNAAGTATSVAAAPAANATPTVHRLSVCPSLHMQVVYSPSKGRFMITHPQMDRTVPPGVTLFYEPAALASCDDTRMCLACAERHDLPSNVDGDDLDDDGNARATMRASTAAVAAATAATAPSCDRHKRLFQGLQSLLRAADELADEFGFTRSRVLALISFIARAHHAHQQSVQSQLLPDVEKPVPSSSPPPADAPAPARTPAAAASASASASASRPSKLAPTSSLSLFAKLKLPASAPAPASSSAPTLTPATAPSTRAPLALPPLSPSISSAAFPSYVLELDAGVQRDPMTSKLVAQVVRQLPASHRAAVTSSMLVRVLHILDVNAHEVMGIGGVPASVFAPTASAMDDSASGEGLFPLFAMIEHSCFETCTFSLAAPRFYRDVDDYDVEADSRVADVHGMNSLSPHRMRRPPTILIHSIRDLPPGASLSINYGLQYQPTHYRRAYLASAYGFTCTCELCTGVRPDCARAFICPDALCGACVFPHGLTDDKAKLFSSEPTGSRAATSAGSGMKTDGSTATAGVLPSALSSTLSSVMSSSGEAPRAGAVCSAEVSSGSASVGSATLHRHAQLSWRCSNPACKYEWSAADVERMIDSERLLEHLMWSLWNPHGSANGTDGDDGDHEHAYLRPLQQRDGFKSVDASLLNPRLLRAVVDLTVTRANDAVRTSRPLSSSSSSIAAVSDGFSPLNAQAVKLLRQLHPSAPELLTCVHPSHHVVHTFADMLLGEHMARREFSACLPLIAQRIRNVQSLLCHLHAADAADSHRDVGEPLHWMLASEYDRLARVHYALRDNHRAMDAMKQCVRVNRACFGSYSVLTRASERALSAIASRVTA